MTEQDRRQSWDLIIAVVDVLERHGYHRADDQHVGRAVGLIGDLAHIYEGTQEAPASTYPVPAHACSPAAAQPASPAADHRTGLGPAQLGTVLMALDEAGDHQRDQAANCADCPDRSCGNCQHRLRQARSYNAVAAWLGRAADAAPPEQRGGQARLRAAPDREAGQ